MRPAILDEVGRLRHQDVLREAARDRASRGRGAARAGGLREGLALVLMRTGFRLLRGAA